MTIKRAVKWTALTIFLALAGWIFIAYWTSTNDCNRNAAPTNPMKAIRYCEYGSPDVVKLRDVEKPVPNDDQVLIKVRAASLNAFDAYVIRDSWLGRLFFGLRKPRDTRLGQDVAGVVEAVGKNVTQFKPGDEVFGTCRGGLAEYTCTRERALAPKPPNVTFEIAAALPLAGLVALQGLREGKIQPGQKVLVNGATGGVGTFATQIAKALGAEVTGVCSTRNVDLVKSIGADRVIDYTKEDFTNSNQRYDVIFDNVCNHSFAERRRVLTPKGICVVAGMGGAGVTGGQAIGRIAGNFTARGLSSFTDQKFALYRIKTSKEDLITLADLVQAGKLKPVIERTYKLGEAPEAFRYLDQGHARGKIIIAVE
ncbi:MAG TPA: NAD(P)-dependent alcohol dehydrogenase [Chthoniobacterales bacterium]|jgi:NADPH:quinone reductase-like Zn-dependent oxidoreductase|nr:NAD(P)-dependent alcohol dehydrogenase [Chthoniobacterales bacterium]